MHQTGQVSAGFCRVSNRGRILRYFIVLVILAFTQMGAVPIPSNVKVTGHQPGRQNAEQVWFCTHDTNVVLAVHQDLRVGYPQVALARSSNGGQSWQDALVPQSLHVFNLQSSPAVSAMPSGEMLISYDDYESSNPVFYDSSHVSIILSADCGANWVGPYTVRDTIGRYLEGRAFAACGPMTGPSDGSVYLSWTRTSAFMRRIMVSRSDNGVDWSEPVVVRPPEVSGCFDSSGAYGLPQPVVGRDGTVYVFWLDYFVTENGCARSVTLEFNKSTDGGNTWESARTLAWTGAGVQFVDSGVTTYAQPVVAVDVSNASHAGNLYLEYCNARSAAPYDLDIWFQRSLDTGHTWSAPFRVNDDPIGPDFDQFHNWMICNEEGILASIWYDQRTDQSHFKFDVFAAYSYDGGATWSANHRVSSLSTDPRLLAGNISTHIGLAGAHDKLVAAWTDTRDGDQDVWSANWHLPLTDPRPLTNSGVTLTCGDSLKWATAWKENEDKYLIQVATSDQFLPNEVVTSGFVNESHLVLPPGLPGATLYWRLKAYRAPYNIPIDSTAYSTANSFTYVGCPCVCDCHRDPICDQSAGIADIVSVVDVAFNNALPAGDPSQNCPHMRADFDCNSVTNVVDVVLMVGVVYRGLMPVDGLCGQCE